MVVVRGERTTLADFTTETPAEIVERIQADARAAVREQGVTVDV